jgi:omega-6 fatty acid desaturase (delta-12 desaturase)
LPVPSISLVKAQKRALISRYARPDNFAGFVQILNTLLPLAALCYAVKLSAGVSYWLTAVVTLPIVLFLMRVFVLMHECGHGSLFRTGRLNRGFGFLLGVICGMPQYVWSRHHAYHHSTNGNWAKYRGPFIVDTADAYAAMDERQRRTYRLLRQIWMLPFHAFVYVLFMPRYTWLKGSASLLWHIARGKRGEFSTRCWNSPLEYWHMTGNNVVLLGAWLAMSIAIGPALFFAVYVTSVSLATAAGIVLFTVQHNFRDSYASAEEGWDYDTAAIEGTSLLVLPGWLNWFTANIAYHHIHHLSARIPNYRLAQCHTEYQHLFSGVARIRLSEIPATLKYILWDTRARRIISVAEFEAQAAAAPAASCPASASG